MLTISDVAAYEKNRLDSPHTWLILLDIDFKIEENFNSGVLDSVVQLTNAPIKSASETVGDTTWMPTYVKDTDYTMDYTNGTISCLSTGDMVASTTYTIEYKLTNRLVKNNADISWNGNTYTAFPFILDSQTQTAKGDIPQFEIKVSNISRLMDSYLQQTNGALGSTVTISVVHSNYLSLTTAEDAETYTITDSHADSQWAYFTLSRRNPFRLQFPGEIYNKYFCRFLFKEDRCGYAGAGTFCTRTLAGDTDGLYGCEAWSNDTRFGGFPNIPFGAYIQGGYPWAKRETGI